MDKEYDFLEIVNEMITVASSQNCKLSQKEIQQYMGDGELDENAKKALYEYLSLKGVSVEGFISKGRDITPENKKDINGNQEKNDSDIDEEKISEQDRQINEKIFSKHIKNNNSDSEISANEDSTMDDKADSAENLGVETSLKDILNTDKKKSGSGKKQGMAFKLYKEEISRIEAVDEETKLNLFKMLLDGRTESFERLSLIYLETIVNIADDYKTKDTLVEDIVAEGNLALIEAFGNIMTETEAYMLENGVADITMIDNFIEASIRKAIETMLYSQSVKKEQDNSLVGKINLIHSAREYMAEEYGRMPTIKELSEYTGVSQKEINDMDELIKD